MTFIRIALALALTGAFALAQQDTASIAGAITDSSGGAVAGATISITSADTKVLVRTTTAGHDGNYSAPLLPIGNYSVKAEAKGFKTAVKENVVLNVSDSLTINFPLEVGNVTETVAVEAPAVQVELQNGSAQSTTINGTQIRELALVTRNYTQLVQLMPGVVSGSVDQLYVGTTLPSGTANVIPYSINGARNSGGTWLVDGADNVDRGGNLTLLTTPSIDAIAEFKVQRSGYSADLGRAGGAQIQVITKSGTSSFHGDMYEFVRNSDFAANNFYNNATNLNLGADGKAQVAPLHYNDFGWTLGGPLYIPKHYNTDKTKTFFFVSEEFRRYITYTSATATVPNQTELTGVFPGAVCTSYTGSTCNSTATTVPQSLVNPVAKEYIGDIFNRIALPSSGTTLVSLFRNVFNFEQELYKIDQNFGPKLQLSARFLRDQIPTIEPMGAFSLGSVLPNVGITNTNAPGNNWVAHATSTFSPTFINEGGAAISYGAILSNPTGYANSKISPDIKSTLPFPVTLGIVPSVTLSGGSSVIGYGPYREYNRNYSYYDNMTKIWGAHTFRYGGVFNHYQKTENELIANNQGTFAFAPASTPATTTTFLQSFANFLTGNVSTFSQASEDIIPDIRANQFEVYFQDDWKIRPNLTLNLGIRYSYFFQPTDANKQLDNFDPAVFNRSAAPALTAGGLFTTNAQNYVNGIIINGQNSPFGNKVSNEDKKDFAPRFGFAWDPDGKGKSSIRGGYGIFFDATLFGTFEQNTGTNPPFVNNLSISNVSFDDPAAGTAAISFTPKVLHATAVDFPTPYTQQWSVSYERQIQPDWLATVSYVGSKGTHLLGSLDINEVQPNLAYTSGLIPTTTTYTTTSTEYPLNVLRPYPGYSGINAIEPWFNSNYNSLQLYTKKDFKSGNQISASYTWSKNLTDNGSDRSNAPQNSYNFNHGEYGPNPYDRTHVFNLNFVYEVPFFKAQKGLVGKALGGWEAAAIASYYTGLPYTVTTSNFDPAALGLDAGPASARPDLLCNPYAGWTSTRTSWFNTACFLNPSAGQHHVGDEGRGVLRGPGYEGWSASLSRNVVWGAEQRYRFQLRGEASNVFNHTNPSTFGSTNNTSSLFGQITGYRDPRIIQLGAKMYF
jgi:hypothetical protein